MKKKSSLLWSAFIPVHPTTKKNSQRIITVRGRPVIIPSEKYQKFEKECGRYIKPPKDPIEDPVNVRVIFYRDSARRCDLTNLLEAADDMLVKHGVLKDDCFKIIRSHDGCRVLIDKERPGLEICIERFDEHEEHTV